jgi:hypothetical protein
MIEASQQRDVLTLRKVFMSKETWDFIIVSVAIAIVFSTIGYFVGGGL